MWRSGCSGRCFVCEHSTHKTLYRQPILTLPHEFGAFLKFFYMAHYVELAHKQIPIQTALAMERLAATPPWSFPSKNVHIHFRECCRLNVELTAQTVFC